MIEIERKFLTVSSEYKKTAITKKRIVQGFLNTAIERTVRVRIKGDQGFITVKGKSNDAGTSRFEWEREISVEDATALLELCEQGILDKIRYEVPYGKDGHIFEVDEFLGVNEGLVLAEIELTHEHEVLKNLIGWAMK